MQRHLRLFGALAGLALLACADSNPIAPPAVSAIRFAAAADEEPVTAEGAGHYDILGLDVEFSFEAEQHRGESAKGEFRVRADEGGGLFVDFLGKVTCLAVDPVNHRAWIGGIVIRNRSTDPDLLTKIHRPGRDIWFRVLDLGDADRSTFVGFKGSAGFLTSEAYCAGRPWPDDNARTWPVTQGGIEIRP
ncbi:MAG: hypothetical protein ACREMW_01050 [Gemmatimonadales bacterium]